jgi:excisionase family DNA binding protein
MSQHEGLSASAKVEAPVSGIAVSIPAAVVDDLVAAVAERVLDTLTLPDHAAPWPEWMSVESAARYMDVSPERLRKLVARREVPFHQEGRRCRVLFRRRDLDEWLNSLRQPANGSAPPRFD